MIDKFSIYRVLFPFRRRRQLRLRQERMRYSYLQFARDVFGGDDYPELSSLLWHCFSDTCALVPDFRPHPSDELASIYGMGLEEVLDDVLFPFAEEYDLLESDTDMSALKRPDATIRDVALILLALSNLRPPPPTLLTTN